MSNQNVIYTYSGVLFIIKINTKQHGQHGGTSKNMLHEISQTQNT